MSIRRALPAFACVLALLLALTGVTSAGLMAPDREAAARLATELAFGLAPGDLCAPQEEHAGHSGHAEHRQQNGHAGHDHPCPFCHGLPEAPALSPGGREARLVPHDGWRQSADRHRAAQARDAGHAPRAPPALS